MTTELKSMHEMMSGKGLDSYSNFIGDSDEFSRQYYLLSQTRDSTILEQSNFQCFEDSLKKANANYEILRFGHWACGWIEHLVLSEDNSRQIFDYCEETLNALSEYPVFDDQHYSQMQWDAIHQYWDDMSLSERIEYCRENGESIFAARHDEIPERVYDSLSDSSEFN